MNYSFKIEKGDLVQILYHPEPSVVGTILQVDSVKEDTVQGFVHVPYKGEAYFRVGLREIVKVGHAALGPSDE
jgi:hypothetical protein